MKVRFVTMEKVSNRKVNTVGSSRIRARWVWKYWDEADEWMIGEKADVLIFQKAWWNQMIENFEGIKIMDICDPEWLDSRRPYFKLMSTCNAVTTSTKALADHVKKLITHIPVIHIPDRVDLEVHKQHEKRKPTMGELKTAVWFGYSHNFYHVEKTFDQIMKMGINLTVIADKPLRAIGDYRGLKLNNINYNYLTIHDELIEHDICLLPSTYKLIDDKKVPDLKGQFKSNNKDLTAYALGIPVAKDPEDLERLNDPFERLSEAYTGRKWVEKEYDVKLSVKQYKKLIKELL